MNPETVKSAIAIDLETTSLDFYDKEHWNQSFYGIVYLGYYSHDMKGVLDIRKKEHRNKARKILSLPRPKVFWNAQFDLSFLYSAGLEVKGTFLDSLIAARIVSPGESTYSLKHFASVFYEDTYPEEAKVHDWLKKNKLKGKIGLAPPELVVPYCLKDVKYTYELLQLFHARLQETEQEHIFVRECQLIPICVEMTLHGLLIHRKGVEKLIEESHQQETRLIKQLRKKLLLPDFSPFSTKQVVEALSGGMAPREVPADYFPHVARQTKGGNTSCDEYSLLREGSEFSTLILWARKNRKARTTYLEPLLERARKGEGRVFPRFNINQAITGRFSSSGGVNFQNLPRKGSNKPGRRILGKVRECIIADKGNLFLFADYDQIELRLLAHFSGEDYMIQAIREGRNLHETTALRLFPKYKELPPHKQKLYYYIAKTMNYAVIYGAGATKLQETMLQESGGQIKISTLEAATYLYKWKEAHPKVMAFIEDTQRQVHDRGEIITPYGRIIPVDPYYAYMGVNYLIQSTAGEILKDAMLKFPSSPSYKKGIRLVATIHDELIYEGPSMAILKETPRIVRAMENHQAFSVPITCSAKIGRNWATGKEIQKPLEQGVKKWTM